MFPHCRYRSISNSRARLITLQYRKWGEAGLSGRIENKMESCKRSERCEMDHETLDGAIPQVFVSSQSPAALLLSSLQSTIAEKNAQYDRGRGRGKSGGFWTLGNCCLLIFQELPYRCNIAHFNRANKCTVCTVTVCTCISSIYIQYIYINICTYQKGKQVNVQYIQYIQYIHQ